MNTKKGMYNAAPFVMLKAGGKQSNAMNER